MQLFVSNFLVVRKKKKLKKNVNPSSQKTVWRSYDLISGKDYFSLSQHDKLII